MGFFSNVFNPQPAPVVIIKSILGEEIDRVPGHSLSGQDLRGKQWPHVDLRALSLAGANLEGSCLFGVHADGTDFSRACLHNCEFGYASVVHAKFQGADARGLLADYAVVAGRIDDRGVPVEFSGAVLDETSNVRCCVVRRMHEPYIPKPRPKVIWPRKKHKQNEAPVVMSEAEDRLARIAEEAERERDRELDAQARAINP